MKPIAAICAFVALASTLTGCNPPAGNHDADVKAVQDTEVQWQQDFTSKDAAKIASYYTDDAIFIECGSPAVNGKAAIQKELSGMVTDPALAVKFHSTTVDVAKSGDIAYTTGPYTIDMTDPATKQVMHDHGTYVTVYRKQADGSWKAAVDTVISEVPPPAPPPPAPAKNAKNK